SKSLDSVPGSSDLKTNLARMAQGNMTQGDKMSAFRNPLEADSIAEPRIGRGLFEPLNAAHPMLMQVWYEENQTLREALTARSEERRVGKECRGRGRESHRKAKHQGHGRCGKEHIGPA